MKIKRFEIGDFILGITTDIGPRILEFAIKKEPEKNVFGIVPDFFIETIEGKWHIFGGHRIWTSPESKPRSYSLDNKPVKVEEKKGIINIYGNPEIQNSVQKEIEIKRKGKELEITHRVKNIGRWPIKFAIWCLTAMKKNGFAIIPLKPKKVDKQGLLPDRRVTFWQYTDISDERLIWNKNYIFVKQDEKIKKPFKIGTIVNPDWTAYYVDEFIFIKKILNQEGEYPDFGCNVEVFTNSEFLELETLSPLKIVEPENYIEHKEIWNLIKVGKLEPEEIKINNALKNYLFLG